MVKNKKDKKTFFMTMVNGAKRLGLLFLLLVSFAFTLFPVFASADDDAIYSIDVNVKLRDDGAADITQIWHTNYFSGTEFFIPQIGLGNIKFENFRVSDETGEEYESLGEQWNVSDSMEAKAGKCGINRTDEGLELCWGKGSFGEHTYTLNYTMTNFVKAYSDGVVGFYSRFVNNRLSDIPQEVSVTIEKEGVELSAENAAIWGFGYKGDILFVEGKVVATNRKPLSYSSHVTILMRIDDGIIVSPKTSFTSFAKIEKQAKDGSDYGEPGFFGKIGRGLRDWYRESKLIVWGFSIFGIIFIIAECFLQMVDPERRPRLRYRNKHTQYYRDIPFAGNMPAAYYGLERCQQLKKKSDIINAYFLRWINLGYMTIKKGEENDSNKEKSNDLSMIFNYLGDFETAIEGCLYKIMLRAADAKGVLREEKFEKWCRSHYHSLESWFKSVKEEGDGYFISQDFLPVQEHNLFFGLYNYEQRRFSTKGRETCLNLLGFKKYLQDFTFVNERKSVEVHLWGEYLSYAALFGIADQVAKEFQDINPEFFANSNYRDSDDFLANYTYMSRVSRSGYRNMKKGHADANAKSSRSGGGGGSSSSGGGGGGFSGGGSGGGSR